MYIVKLRWMDCKDNYLVARIAIFNRKTRHHCDQQSNPQDLKQKTLFFKTISRR